MQKGIKNLSFLILISINRCIGNKTPEVYNFNLKYKKAKFYPVISLFKLSKRYEDFIRENLFVQGTLRAKNKGDKLNFYLEEGELKIQITPWFSPEEISSSYSQFLNKRVIVYGNLQKAKKIRTVYLWIVPDSFKKREVKEDEFIIHYREEVKTDDWILKFLEVLEDSRCPQGGRCKWEGRVRVAIEIDDENEKGVIILEEKGLHKGEILSYKGKNFLFHVLPYPEYGKEYKKEEYFIKFKKL